MRELFNYLSYKFKKKFYMNYDEEQRQKQKDEQEIARLKPQYFGKVYKWEHPINGEEKGELARVVDIKKREGQFCLVFNAGTPVPISSISQYLKLEGSAEQSMPMSDVPLAEALQAGLPPELIAFSTPANQQIQQAPATPGEQPRFELGTRNDAQPQRRQHVTNPFAQLQADEKYIKLSVKTKLPKTALVKMMYDNAADKDKFIEDVASYIIGDITPESVKDSLKLMLGDAKKTKENDRQEPDPAEK